MRNISLRTLPAHHEGIGERETHGGDTVPGIIAAMGHEQVRFLQRNVAEAKDGQDARVAGLGAAL